jgi:hypothetical protein
MQAGILFVYAAGYEGELAHDSIAYLLRLEYAECHLTQFILYPHN